MKPAEELPVILESYELTAWLLPKINKFPRDQKFLLGDRMQTTVLDILERLIEAKFRRGRSELLDRANVELEKLRSFPKGTKNMTTTSTIVGLGW